MSLVFNPLIAERAEWCGGRARIETLTDVGDAARSLTRQAGCPSVHLRESSLVHTSTTDLDPRMVIIGLPSLLSLSLLRLSALFPFFFLLLLLLLLVVVVVVSSSLIILHGPCAYIKSR